MIPMKRYLSMATGLLLTAGLWARPAWAAETTDGENERAIGVKIRLGGRYDDVRMCVASPPGAKGGLAMDISFFAERELASGASLAVDLPVMRPILFGLAFRMLQLEPTVGLKWRLASSKRLLLGPVVGLSLHYGPDYTSAASGNARGSPFFALGPILGGYLGWDLRRSGKAFGPQLGITPYVAPLFGVGDERRGVVAGGQVDLLLGAWR